MVAKNLAYGPVSTRAAASGWLVRAAVAAAVGGVMFSPGVYAADGAADEGTELEEVTVTGSRIVRRDLNAPSPIVTVSAETFEKTSTTSMEATLNKLPSFKPAGNQFVSGAQTGPTVTPGAATLNLRGIGPNRNLVLVDGRRAQPANASLVIDINTIPQAAIQGVEVITGGASAVYGPDAIAGVTNFLLKRDFQGLDVDVQSGLTQKGDGGETKIGVLLGLNAGDGKGNVMMGLDYAKRGDVLQRDRSFYQRGWSDPANGGADFTQPAFYVAGPANPPSQLAVNTVLPVSGVTPASEIYFNADGSAWVKRGAIGYNGPLNQLGGATESGQFSSRYDNIVLRNNGVAEQFYTNQFLSTPSERHSLFMRGIYDVTENTSAFLQANYSNSKVITRGNYAPAVTLWGATIPRDDIVHTGLNNPLITVATPTLAVGAPNPNYVAPNATVKRTLPAELVTLLNSRTRNIGTAAAPNIVSAANEPWSLGQVLSYFGALESTNTTNLWQMMAGVNGKLAIKDWTWESYYARGETKTEAEIPQPSLQRYQALVSSPNFGRNANFTGPAVPLGRGYSLNCTSGLPVFSEFTPSADCIDSISIRGKQLTNSTQDVFEANMQGAAFDLPAGEARFAAGVAYRKNGFRFDPSYPVEFVLDNPIGLFASNKTAGSTNVKELYGELLAPIVGGLELELGYRLSDFNTAGTEGTYKALFTWKAHESVTFRGGYQVATRAPNTAELFAGQRLEVVGFPGQDPCSAATFNLWGNRAQNPNRTQVQAVCRAIVNKARIAAGQNVTLTDTTSLYDTQQFNVGVVFAGIPLGAGANGYSRQGSPFFPLEIEVERGNPNLKPETAKTWTLGAVIREPFGMSGLNVTVDAYQIKLTDTISRFSGFAAYYLCLNANGTSNPSFDPNNQYCNLIGRNANTADREQTLSSFENLGDLNTRGLDLTVAWKGDMGPGQLSTSVAMNYLDQYEYQPFNDAPFNDAAGTFDQGGQYRYSVLTNVGYDIGAFDVGLEWRHLPSIHATDTSLVSGLNGTTTVTGAGAYEMFNLSAGYDLGNIKLRAGVDNLFDKGPLVVGANAAAGDSNTNLTNLSYYDGLGRRFYVGAKISF
jgi:iron complex outermembrane recepter protein